MPDQRRSHLCATAHTTTDTQPVFGDTHFDFKKSTLTSEAWALLGKNIQVLKDLIEKGIKAERIKIYGYGRIKPTLFEVAAADINSPEAKANMRVLFEIDVK